MKMWLVIQNAEMTSCRKLQLRPMAEAPKNEFQSAINIDNLACKALFLLVGKAIVQLHISS